MSSETRNHKEAMQTYDLRSRPLHVWGIWPPPAAANSAGPLDAAQRSTVRTIVVDDQAMVRRSLRRELRLEPDLEVVGEADTAAAGLALAQDVHPDIVVMGVEMPIMDGVQAAERLHALAPDCAILLLTARDSVETHERAKAAGVRVIVEKGNPGIFRSSFHDLVQFVKARNTPAWLEVVERATSFGGNI